MIVALQSLKNGKCMFLESPIPQISEHSVLIETELNLISIGTEKMISDFGRSNWITRARTHPEKVKDVLNKISTDGVFITSKAILNKLNQPLQFGYSNVGTIIKVGSAVSGFNIGDRVVSNGYHAEVVCVSSNLCCLIPKSVSSENAVFSVIGAIALHAIRISTLSIGEVLVVIGAGLVGLIAVQLAVAQGCRVIIADYSEERLKKASSYGAMIVNLSINENLEDVVNELTNNIGADVVLICAATNNNDPIERASKVVRQRGNIVLVGVCSIQINRDIFYKKEINFRVSCSYGPGRYDPTYEVDGIDYPIAHIRWTAKRNISAIINLLEQKKLNFTELITQKVNFSELDNKYVNLLESKSELGILISHQENENKIVDKVILNNNIRPPENKKNLIQINVAFIGAGQYAGKVLFKAFKDSGVNFQVVSSFSGVNAAFYGKKFGFNIAANNTDLIYKDTNINVVVIATRHNQHADQVIGCLQSGKNIFCEKPLCLTTEELERIKIASNASPHLKLMVGFNRRFSPQIKKMVDLMKNFNGAKFISVKINAGFLPEEHWTKNKNIGGGRIVGEACHFIDLTCFLAKSKVTSNSVEYIDSEESAVITLKFENGTIGIIEYYTNGNPRIPKERIEITFSHKTIILENFKKLKAYGFGAFKGSNLWVQNKGNKECVKAFVDHLKYGGVLPIQESEIFDVTALTIEIAEKIEKMRFKSA